MTPGLVPESSIRNQAFYYYLVLILWPVYLFLLPAVFVYSGWLVLLYLIFPGLYLFTWLGYLMHESWHRYVPTVNNRFFYNAFAFMILSDPQLYFITHGTHHGQVNTFQDAEFHPVGEIKTRWYRIVYNFFEIVLGVGFLVIVGSLTIRLDKRFARDYKIWKILISFGVWVIFLGSLSYLSQSVFNVTLSQTLIPYALIYWLGSFLLHQSQLIEHGNLIIEGGIQQRNNKTRNLRHERIIEKVFLFLTHNDSREHVLHHTMTKNYLRPFPGYVNLPDDAVMITLSDYLRILGRMLKGKVDREIVH
jgi:fatty acid desaturase